jgi:hypothetical protein
MCERKMEHFLTNVSDSMTCVGGFHGNDIQRGSKHGYADIHFFTVEQARKQRRCRVSMDWDTISGINHNLFSFSDLYEMGVRVHFEEGACRAVHQDERGNEVEIPIEYYAEAKTFLMRGIVAKSSELGRRVVDMILDKVDAGEEWRWFDTPFLTPSLEDRGMRATEGAPLDILTHEEMGEPDAPTEQEVRRRIEYQDRDPMGASLDGWTVRHCGEELASANEMARAGTEGPGGGASGGVQAQAVPVRRPEEMSPSDELAVAHVGGHPRTISL